MTDPLNVFILAAGFGERLLPITNHIPKPLLPFTGKPLLQILLEKVSRLSLQGIGINLHHKRNLIEDWISSSGLGGKITMFNEAPILGTGGALKNAEPFLLKGVFLVHNADIISNIDLARLVDLHRSSGNLATLAVHDCPGFNTVAIDSNGFFKGVGNSSDEPSPARRVAFTGISVYSPEFLGFLPHGVSSVVDAWRAAKASGHRIGTWDVSGCYWSDIGTPSAFASAVIAHMTSDGENVFVHSSAEGCPDARMDGYVIIEEKCMIGRGASMRNCIALPGADLHENTSYENCIAGPDFIIPLAEEEIMPTSGNVHVFPIGSGGSDRKYYRVRKKEGSSVLMRFSGNDADFRRHIMYTEFFRRYGVPVPALLRVDEDRTEALFEDLGDLSLYSWLKCRRSEDNLEAVYRKVIDIAVTIHTKVTAHISDCPLLRERIFDHNHLRWETRYFMENFVALIRNIGFSDMALLEDDFDRLARHVDSFSKCVMHRDFQSQNIMMAKGKIPRLIDYQGARIGPPAYDMASLLWDPYYRLEDRVRDRLITHYVEKMTEDGDASFDEGAFRSTLLPCRLQRHMQALGAYGFLSSVKGKKYFLKHAKEGVRLLKEDVSLVKEEYPALHELTLAL